MLQPSRRQSSREAHTCSTTRYSHGPYFLFCHLSPCLPSGIRPRPSQPMAWPRESLEALLEGGPPPEDMLVRLQHLAHVGKPTDPSDFLHRLQAIFSHPQHFTSPLDLPLTWLVAFMLRRHPTPHPQEPPWVDTFYNAQHPLYTWTPHTVQDKVRCHAPTKATGDPFAAAYQQFVHNARRTSHQDKRELFVMSALILVPRSQALLDFFTLHSQEPLTQHTITQLYSYFLERQNIYPGLTATRSRQAHTTEQKVLSLGTLIDVFLVPFLLDNTHWDGHLVLDSAAFVGDLSAMPWLKGALQHVHFCDYAILAGIMQEVPDNEHYARNSRLFLEMTAHGNYETVAAALAPYLPFVCTWRDASASACMVVRLMEAFLAGSTLGKGRFAEYRPDMSPFQARLRTNLDRHPVLDPTLLDRSLLYQGCRYISPGIYCQTLGITTGSAPRRTALHDVSRSLLPLSSSLSQIFPSHAFVSRLRSGAAALCLGLASALGPPPSRVGGRGRRGRRAGDGTAAPPR